MSPGLYHVKKICGTSVFNILGNTGSFQSLWLIVEGHSAPRRPHAATKSIASVFNRWMSHPHQIILSLHHAGGRQHRSLHGRALEHTLDFAADAADPEGLAPLRRVPAGRDPGGERDARQCRRGGVQRVTWKSERTGGWEVRDGRNNQGSVLKLLKKKQKCKKLIKNKSSQMITSQPPHTEMVGFKHWGQTKQWFSVWKRMWRDVYVVFFTVDMNRGRWILFCYCSRTKATKFQDIVSTVIWN